MTNSVRERRQRIAVIGAGIAGLGAAWALSKHHQVTLFEASAKPGGHSNTVDVDYDGTPMAVDTGFIVFNDWNYPNLRRLFAHLDVPAIKSDMSFSVSVGAGELEWSGNTLATLFAQKRNLLRPSFHRMWRDILRFNKRAVADLADGSMAGLSLGDYLARQRYGDSFMLDYLLPMGAAIWSAPLAEMQAFPAETFARFFKNHGLLSINDRPQWYTVQGGSREYVKRLIANGEFDLQLHTPVYAVRREAPDQSGGVSVVTARGTSHFDQVVLACHGDQALRLLDDRATTAERDILSSFRFQSNRAVLHRDLAQMPQRRSVWASWNYLSEPRRDLQRRVGLTYWMNLLQSLDSSRPLFVTMNPVVEPRPELVFAEFAYDHPLFDRAAIDAQAKLPTIQGKDRLWFCGAWCRYGFHEDGFSAGLQVAAALGAQPFAESSALPEAAE